VTDSPRLDAAVFDPARYGYVLQRTIGRLRPGDYQDLRNWRRATVRGALRRSRSDRPLLVPMTVLEPAYLHEILGGLRDRGRAVLHVTLHASSPALRDRIQQDTVDLQARTWRLRQLPRYEAALAGLREHGPVVDTGALTPDQVADTVLGLVEQPSARP